MACGLRTGQTADDERILSNSIGMRFVLIPAGTFMMGSPEAAESVAANPAYSDAPGLVKWYQDEHPLHRVTISRPFYLQETEVTLAQFRRFVSATGFRTDSEKEGVNWQAPGFSQGDNEPVVYISRNDAEAFVAWLNKKEDTDRYSLPTEAQWEYACRAGTETPYYWGTLPDGGKANFADGSYSRAYPKHKGVNRSQEDGHVHTAPVARYPANPFGLYDMSGNAFEWCKDWFGEYSAAPARDPRGPAEGKRGVLRGGAWQTSAMAIRSAARASFDPGRRDNFTGFRVARTY
jgi:formylglycine-generating enzyme required for sulfatase activity